MPTPLPAPAVLRCDVEVQNPPSRYPHAKRLKQPAEARIVVHIAERNTPYVYVIHVDSAQLVTVLLEAGPGPELRLPTGPAWLPLPQAGTVVAVGAHEVLLRAQLAALLGGREPDATKTKAKNT